MDNNPAAVIELADVEFWPATGRLCCGARSARLTGQPSRMLELLLRHRGVLVTRDQLMVALYAHRTGQPADPKILDVWMLRIRRLLCALGSAIEIKTVFGRGFVTAGAAMQPARAELIAALQRAVLELEDYGIAVPASVAATVERIAAPSTGHLRDSLGVRWASGARP